jgi:amicoumacin kinase
VPGYYVTVLEKVPGTHPEGANLTPDMIALLGQTLGRMHRLARAYVPSDPALRRPDWHALELFDFDKTIPASQPAVRARCQSVLAEVRALPVDDASYGLIHADPEPWNFLVHDGQVAIIDFDDCCYHWFAFDVAVALLYITWAADRHDDPTFPQRAWDALWASYQTEYTLTDFWRGQIPLLLRLRIMEDYAFHIRIQAEGNTEDWLPGVIAHQRHLIESQAPVLNVNFL